MPYTDMYRGGNISLLSFKSQGKIIFYADITVLFGTVILTLLIFLT